MVAGVGAGGGGYVEIVVKKIDDAFLGMFFFGSLFWVGGFGVVYWG